MFSPLTSEACEKSSCCLWNESCVRICVRKPWKTCVTDRHNMTLAVNPFSHIPILGPSNSAANKDMKTLPNGDTIF